jgi:hypothetical protein
MAIFLMPPLLLLYSTQIQRPQGPNIFLKAQGDYKTNAVTDTFKDFQKSTFLHIMPMSVSSSGFVFMSHNPPTAAQILSSAHLY